MKLWIVRDRFGLFLFLSRPVLEDDNLWHGIGFQSLMGLPIDSFPEVTFENSPREVELKLI